MDAPSELVLREFGARGETEWFSGGQGTTWRAGDIVLKPLDMSVPDLVWQASVLSEVLRGDVRVAVPLRSRSGELIVDGWTAWPRLEGRHAPLWVEIVDAGKRFHAAVATVARPSHLLDPRSDHWAQADRIAWGETAMRTVAAGSSIEWLLKARHPIALTDQLIHGDLSGNVLLADGQPPAIVDLSPYWRPKEYATAVVVVDAVAWHDADVQELEPLLDRRHGRQLLIRAALFRILSDPDPSAGRYDVLLRHLQRQAF